MVRGNAMILELGVEDSRGDAEPHDLNTFGTHEYIPLVLDNVFEVLVHSDVVRTNQKIEELEWLKERIDWESADSLEVIA